MKSIKNFMLLMAASAVLLFSSCEKQVKSSPVKIDEGKTATINVYLTAELDATKVGEELVPEGTLVKVYVNNSDFSNIAASANTGTWSKMDTVDAEGKISLEVPCDDNGVTVRIQPTQFYAPKVFVAGTNGTLSTPVTGSYEVAEKTIAAVKPNVAYSEKISYNIFKVIGNDQSVYDVELSGKITAVFTYLGTPAAADDVSLIFFTKKGSDINWSSSVKTANGGLYKIMVPGGTQVYFKYEFIRKYDLTISTSEDHIYTSSETPLVSSTLTASKNTANFSLGSGSTL